MQISYDDFFQILKNKTLEIYVTQFRFQLSHFSYMMEKGKIQKLNTGCRKHDHLGISDKTFSF
jgi:hypothetical protein